MDLGLKNKVALVLSGGGGLGRAISVSLAREGAKIAIAGIRLKSVNETAADVTKLGARALALEWDLGNLDIIEQHVALVESELGPIDILINNTGSPPATPAAGQPPAVWIKNFEQMVLSVIAITDRVLPGMRDRKWGRIITSTSSGVVSPLPHLAISNALRMSLVGWSKTLAREVGPHGVTANIVVPGRIATARVASLDQLKAGRENRSVKDVEKESHSLIPAGRYGRPEEYGGVVAFLASEQASYINGSIIRVDGGLIQSL